MVPIVTGGLSIVDTFQTNCSDKVNTSYLKAFFVLVYFSPHKNMFKYNNSFPIGFFY